ncbi:hypothetical protein [Flavobacterium sp. N1736]|uniref:hypothetical protein n=1 Tax=Flavobacterium sp. N1736 TaxID=2986823 RepID=UPI002224EB0F|nr:hypothetical protein [Flavobacterium sp. N1736]
MKLNFINSVSKVLIAASLFFSCSSDLDFDQVKDLKLEPVFVANLAYFDLPANKIIDNGEGQIAFDVDGFDVLKNKFFNKHLKKAEFNFEIENTINRAFSVAIILLNDSNEILDTSTFQIPAYTGGSNIIKYPPEVFENQRLDILKQATKIGFIVRIASGPPLNQNSVGNLKLHSSATVYMEIE